MPAMVAPPTTAAARARLRARCALTGLTLHLRAPTPHQASTSFPRGRLVAMASHDVLVPTRDGQCPASFHVPDGDGPWPAVIMFPDAGGMRDTFRDMGARLSSFGLAVLVPDPYYRSGAYAPFLMETAFTDPGERDRMMSLAGSLTTDDYVSDAAGYVDFLGSRPEVRPGPVGTTGYCMGGRMSISVAGRLGASIGAAMSFHGGRLAVADDPDSPHN